MRSQSVVNLDPIDRTRKRQDSLIGKIFKTRHKGGSSIKRTAEIGHYMFCGAQRSGKTVSMVWFAEHLIRKWTKAGYNVIVYSNLGIGGPITKNNLHDTINRIEYQEKKVIYIFMIDEIHSYFPRESKDSATCKMIDALCGDFSQVAKRNIYILSTAQIYGRLNKSLREQCLYMIDNHPTYFTNRIHSEFIPEKNLICDEQGRWAGIAKYIIVHGKSDFFTFDTHKLITE